MSRDSSFVTKFAHNPDSGYDDHLFHTTGSPNTNSLSHPLHDPNSKNNSFNTNGNIWGNFPDNVAVTDDRFAVLTWLSPLEPNLRHYNIQAHRVEGVGDWLLRTEQFRSWCSTGDQGESQQAVIFCYGNPGVGKTFICSLVIDSLCNAGGGSGEDVVVACFYLDFAAQEEQSATSILRALLKQVVRGLDQIPNKIMDAFRNHTRVIGGNRLPISEIVKLLGSFSSLRRTFFCLDALDECATADRAKILLSFKDIIDMAPNTRVFLTGRPHLCTEVERHLPCTAVVSISPQRDDIFQFIRSKLENDDPTPEEMDEKLKADILENLEPFSEMFLLVDLNLDQILQEATIHGRRERLGVTAEGPGLGGAYDAMLERIRAQSMERSRLGVAALMWLCHLERPLGAEELCLALAIEIGSVDHSADNVPSIRTVLICCQGLVVKDEEGSTVRLSHFTLQEYLTSHPNLFQNPHAKIAETCLTYLNSPQVINLSAPGFRPTEYTAFLEYSALHWGTHMKKEPSGRGTALALKLFNHYEYHISVKILLEHTLGQNFLGSNPTLSRFGGLHCASMFGVVEVVRALVAMNSVDINRVDDTGATPLIWASRGGHWGVVEVLLAREDIIPDWPDGSGQTPMSWAARNGHEEVVELFLRRQGINPDSADYYGQTPISHAAENGHVAVVNLLLGREDVHPDTLDIWGQTAFSYASRWIASQSETTQKPCQHNHLIHQEIQPFFPSSHPVIPGIRQPCRHPPGSSPG